MGGSFRFLCPAGGNHAVRITLAYVLRVRAVATMDTNPLGYADKAEDRVTGLWGAAFG